MKWTHIFYVLIIFFLVEQGNTTTNQKIEKSIAIKANDSVAVDSFLDIRNNKKYALIKVDNLWWFNQDLDFDTPTSEYFDSKNKEFSKSRLYFYKDAVKACPKGWRLPTLKEFDVFLNQISEKQVYGIAELNYNWDNINENHSKGFKFNKTGFLHKKKRQSKSSFNMWIYNEKLDDAYHAHMYETDTGNLQLFRHTHEHKKPKKNRKFAVRCVCEDSNR